VALQQTVRRTMYAWDRSQAIIFAISVCALNWTLSIAGSFSSQIKIEIPSLQFALGSNFVLLTAASLLPAVFCVVFYPECRSSLKKVNASWAVYFVAIAVGFLPFGSYFGSHYSALPWGRPAAMTLIRVFALNLCLSPLWEEIIWRGCFLNKVRSFSSTSGGILLSSIGWTIWHGGYIAYLYSGGIPIRVLSVLPATYFCSGIIFCSLFEMGGGSLWPCVLLHSAFNASTLVYYQSYNRVSEISSYVAELIVTALMAAIFFRIAIRRSRSLQALMTCSPKSARN
jgi:membrane protease YdiL (CAAX protease family)